MTVKRTIKRRGGGKKKTLFNTTYVTYSLVDNYEEQEEARKAFAAWGKTDLKAYLARVEKTSKAILKAHDLPTTWREILQNTNNYDLPLNASYAADILTSIHKVREFIKRGDTINAVGVAIRLGGYIACNDAEVMAGDRESGRTSDARDKQTARAKERRASMRAIAEELFDWKPGNELTKPQRRKVNETLLRKYKPIDRPTSYDMSNDALEIGLRIKKGI